MAREKLHIMIRDISCGRVELFFRIYIILLFDSYIRTPKSYLHRVVHPFWNGQNINSLYEMEANILFGGRCQPTHVRRDFRLNCKIPARCDATIDCESQHEPHSSICKISHIYVYSDHKLQLIFRKYTCLIFQCLLVEVFIPCFILLIIL